VREVIAELLAAYEAAGLTCGRGLLPPSDEVTIRGLEEALSPGEGVPGVVVPGELRELWAIHGGQREGGRGPGDRGLLGRHRLHAPGEVAERHRLLWDAEPYHPEWGHQPALFQRPVPEQIPFASWDQYTLLVYAADGSVWEHSPSAGLLRRQPSLSAVLRQLLEAVRAGAEPDFGW